MPAVNDYDSPWKEALEHYFQDFLALLFPDIHAAIDWKRGHEMLDKELQQVVREAELGRRQVDKLVKVWRPGGAEAWVLVHVEVQGQVDEDFARRMYIYNYRLFDRYNREVVSLAVLADERPDWRPHRFRSELWGCSAGIDFPVVKLLDYASSEEVLAADANRFAPLVLAHLKTQQTSADPEDRRQWKLRLVKGLYDRGLSRQDIRELFRVIDWMMVLPEGLGQLFWSELQQYEQEKRMPYVTSVERWAIERGREEGRAEGREEGREEGRLESVIALVARGLELKFGARGKRLLGRVRRITDLAALHSVHDALMTASTLDEFRQALP